MFVDDPTPPGCTKLHFVAKMDEIEIKLCNHEMEFADVLVQGRQCLIIIMFSFIRVSVVECFCYILLVHI